MKFRSRKGGLMLAVAVGLSVGVLSACDSKPAAPAPATASAPATTAPMGSTTVACTASVSREIAFTAADAKDVLQAQALGADCKQAAIVFTLRDATGKLLWTHAVEATNTWAFEPDQDGKDVIPSDGVHKLMDETLKNARLDKSKAAPDWPAGKERPQDPTGLFHTTPLLRETYLEMRNKDLPMLCLDHHAGRSVCIVYDPMTPDLATELYQAQS